jgi:hypothetical protein
MVSKLEGDSYITNIQYLKAIPLILDPYILIRLCSGVILYMVCNWDTKLRSKFFYDLNDYDNARHLLV